MRIAFVPALAIALGCGGPSGAPAAEPILENAGGSAPAEIVDEGSGKSRGLYVGINIGIEIPRHPDMSTLRLPEGMQRHSSMTHADGWRAVVAHRRDELVLLLTDEEGVVVDDFTVARSSHKLLMMCGEELPDFNIGLVSVAACPSETAPAALTERSWRPTLAGLEEGPTKLACPCDLNF